MRILLASSEVHPYSKTGGLADMTGALAKALAKAGHQVGMVTPLHRGIAEKHPKLKKLDWRMRLPLGDREVEAEVWTLTPEPRLTLYFIKNPAFYDRKDLYQEFGIDYHDNAERYIFFAKAVAHLARYLPWKPELIHTHDWQAAPVAMLVWHMREREGWGTAPPVCLTIHNLAYQGLFPASVYPLFNLPGDYFQPGGAEFYGHVNCLKSGIEFSDRITTVSPRYAREITTELFGCGLDNSLRLHESGLLGIVNGVDYDEWKTVGNPHLNHEFTPDNLAGKRKIQAGLQAGFGLPVRADVPLFGTISRLTEQKGMDIQLPALEEMLAADIQFVLLGSGSPRYEDSYRALARRYPGKVGVKIGYDLRLSHCIEAGCDFYLMPSRFEPCGLNQMYSLRYGTIPVVRGTGGLDDTVIDIAQDPQRANGIKFYDYTPRALSKAIRKALVLYAEPRLMALYRKNGMLADFSWDRTAKEYEHLYRSMLGEPV